MQKLVVKVITHAKTNEIVDDFTDILNARNIKLKVSTPPEGGKANIAVIALLADYLKVKKSQITITHGKHSPLKLVSVGE